MKYLFLIFTTLLFAGQIAAQQSSSVIAAKSPDALYVGGVLKTDNINSGEHTVLPVLDDLVTVSFDGIAVKSMTYQVDKENMYQSLFQALSAAPAPVFKASSSFSYSLQTISAYKEVETHLGQTIDLEDWFGINDNAHRQKTLLALDINSVAFTLHLDLPADGEFDTDPHELSQHRIEDLIYVNSLSFGRRVLLLIESNLERETVNRAIRNVMEDDVSNEDELVLANCTFRAVTFGSEELAFDPSTPFSQILDYFNEEFTAENFGLPISFSSAYLQNNGVFTNIY